MPHKRYGKVGLLLNGGGAKGICQAGEIQAFIDHGIPYDVSYGSSVGSLNGAMLHQGAMSEMFDMWMSIRTKDVYKWSICDLRRPLTDQACLYNSSPLLKLIKRSVDPSKMYRHDADFCISATNYSTWKPLIESVNDLSEEEIITLLYASASPPVYFPFVKFRGQTLADAGVLTNYNIARAVKDGCDTLVVMGFAIPEPKEPHNIAGTLSETLSISMYGYFERELGFVEKINEIACEELRTIKVVRIIPSRPTGIPLLDFDYEGMDREALWQSGYDLAQRILKEQLP